MKLLQKLMIAMALIGLAGLAIKVFKGTFDWWDSLDYLKDFLLYWLIYRLAGKVDE